MQNLKKQNSGQSASYRVGNAAVDAYSNTQGKNMLAAMIFDPFNTETVVAPNLDDLSKSAPKTVQGMHQYPIGLANVMIVWLPYNPNYRNKLVVLDPNQPDNPLLAILPLIEDLPESFDSGVLVGAGIAIKGVTVPIGNFAFNGTITTVSIYAPDFKTLTNDTLSTLRYTNGTYYSGPLLDGAVALKVPWRDLDSKPFETSEQNADVAKLVSMSVCRPPGGGTPYSNPPNPGWFDGSLIAFDSILIPGFIPPNCGLGPWEINATIPFLATPGATYGVTVRCYIANATGVFIVDFVQEMLSPSSVAVIRVRHKELLNPGSGSPLNEGFLFRIQILRDSTVPPLTANPLGETASVKLETVNLSDYMKVCSVFSFSEMSIGQVVQISQIEHWNVLPTNALIKNVKTMGPYDSYHIQDTSFVKQIGKSFQFNDSCTHYFSESYKKHLLALSSRDVSPSDLGYALPAWMESMLGYIPKISKGLRNTSDVIDYAVNKFGNGNFSGGWALQDLKGNLAKPNNIKEVLEYLLKNLDAKSDQSELPSKLALYVRGTSPSLTKSELTECKKLAIFNPDFSLTKLVKNQIINGGSTFSLLKEAHQYYIMTEQQGDFDFPGQACQSIDSDIVSIPESPSPQTTSKKEVDGPGLSMEEDEFSIFGTTEAFKKMLPTLPMVPRAKQMPFSTEKRNPAMYPDFVAGHPLFGPMMDNFILEQPDYSFMNKIRPGSEESEFNRYLATNDLANVTMMFRQYFPVVKKIDESIVGALCAFVLTSKPVKYNEKTFQYSNPFHNIFVDVDIQNPEKIAPYRALYPNAETPLYLTLLAPTHVAGASMELALWMLFKLYPAVGALSATFDFLELGDVSGAPAKVAACLLESTPLLIKTKEMSLTMDSLRLNETLRSIFKISPVYYLSDWASFVLGVVSLAYVFTNSPASKNFISNSNPIKKTEKRIKKAQEFNSEHNLAKDKSQLNILSVYSGIKPSLLGKLDADTLLDLKIHYGLARKDERKMSENEIKAKSFDDFYNSLKGVPAKLDLKVNFSEVSTIPSWVTTALKIMTKIMTGGLTADLDKKYRNILKKVLSVVKGFAVDSDDLQAYYQKYTVITFPYAKFGLKIPNYMSLTKAISKADKYVPPVSAKKTSIVQNKKAIVKARVEDFDPFFDEEEEEEEEEVIQQEGNFDIDDEIEVEVPKKKKSEPIQEKKKGIPFKDKAPTTAPGSMRGSLKSLPIKAAPIKPKAQVMTDFDDLKSEIDDDADQFEM